MDALADVVVRSHWDIEVAKTAVSEAYDFQLVFFGEVPLVPLYKHPFQVVVAPQLLDLFVAHWPNELVAGKQLLDGLLISAQMTLCEALVICQRHNFFNNRNQTDNRLKGISNAKELVCV